MDYEEQPTARQVDDNGYITVRDNPIIRAGVFPYAGSQLPGGDPNQIYNVYRPIEELTRPETLASLAGLPIIDEHEMLGDKYNRSPEQRGVHGATLENISVRGLDILAPLRIFSSTLKSLIDAGKKELSLGYRCRFEKSAGEFAGIAYNYIQRDILGNHLALVTQGRNGTVVLDQQDVFDHFDLALDTEELKMAENAVEEKSAEKDVAAEKDITIDDVHKFVKKNVGKWDEVRAMMTAKDDDGESDATDAKGDTSEKDGEQKEAEDAEECETKKDAMDAADVKALIAKEIGGMRNSIVKEITGSVAARDALAAKLVPHIGTFACDSMDLGEVAAYGAKKLELNAPKGQEAVAVESYLAGLAKNAAKQTFAMDTGFAPKPKEGSKLAERAAADAQ